MLNRFDFDVRNTALKQPGLSFLITLNQTMRSQEILPDELCKLSITLKSQEKL